MTTPLRVGEEDLGQTTPALPSVRRPRHVFCPTGSSKRLCNVFIWEREGLREAARRGKLHCRGASWR
ncbi:hypothetical protein E2C01_043975 [Portunus trituberculatus]|uniref:Uncharacterized protein n=1 Tax=Portunus trituberculatus TaxID=210409 RepID=A0A5B7FUC3_PORTR|nr:hypothetical protein [Portunus trituberculatus]